MRPSRVMSIAITVTLLTGCSAAPKGASPVPTGAGSLATASPPAPPSPSPSSGAIDPSPTQFSPDLDPVPEFATVGHVVDCVANDDNCEVHLTLDGVADPAGWPVRVDGPCPELRTARSGLAFVGCSPSDGTTIHVLGLDGEHLDGWPVRIDGTFSRISWHDFSITCGVNRSAIEPGSDDSLYVAISGVGAARVHVLDPDGSRRAGWPQPIPGDAPGPDGFGGDGCRGFAVANDNGVVAWGYHDVDHEIELAARRTEFVSWSADGKVRPGWPRGSAGAASGPVLHADGGITYVSATGRVWSHDDAGEIRPGWPYQLDRPAPPYVAPDGRVAIVLPADQAKDRLVLLRPDGTLLSGAPMELPADIETRCLFGDTPCAGVTSLAFASDGTLYLSLAWSTTEHVIPETTNMGGALVAYDPDGAIVDGWPIDLDARTHVLDVSVDLQDRLVAHGFVCAQDYCGGDATVATTFVFAPDGQLLERRTED